MRRCSNILHTREFLKITNFCRSTGFEKKRISKNRMSSLFFMAPERIDARLNLKRKESLFKCDIWSVGIIIYLLAFGQLPFYGSNPKNLVKCITSSRISCKNESNEHEILTLIDFIETLLNPKVAERPDASAALRHRFITRQIKRPIIFKDLVLLQTQLTV